MRFFTKFFLLFILLMCCSEMVKADPIRIVSGTANQSPSQRFDLKGEDNSRFLGYWRPGGFGPIPSPTLFQSGKEFDLNVSFFWLNGVADSTVPFNGQFFLDGSYTTPNGTSTFVNYFNYSNQFVTIQNSMLFSTQNILIPVGAPQTFTTQIPFEMQGILTPEVDCYYIQSLYGYMTPCNTLSFPTQVYGTGTATYSFERTYQDPNKYELYGRSYAFSTPEPTPEPATLLLLGTGLAGVFGYAQRKRKANKSTD